MIFVVVDAYFTLADDLELISMHHDGGAFVDADAEQFRMGSDYRNQIVLAVAGDHMLIDGRVLQQAKTFHMWRRDHDGVVSIGIAGSAGGAAHQKRALDRRSSRTASNYASAGKDSLDFSLGQGAKVGIREPP